MYILLGFIISSIVVVVVVVVATAADYLTVLLRSLREICFLSDP